MNTKLYAGVAFAALLLPASAFAQSTGSQDFEDTEIVVTGSADRDVGGIRIPDSPKAKIEVSQELIQVQQPGQSINQIINLVPGVSFTNNDPFGSSGGSFTIRGFDSNRIAQTFDGLPLNDSGNYALYSNQQLDPELVENINVNLGSTDVDSPTAAAVGGTVNINSLRPSNELGASLVASYGDIVADGAGSRPFHRVFGLIQTGDITGKGTTAWIAASSAYNKASFANYGKVDKQQYNAKIRQEIGGNGDFVSIAGHYNENRNNFGGSSLRADSFTGTAGAVQANKRSRFYDIAGGYPCQVVTPTVARVDVTNGCGTDFERRFNPSNTGNVRLNSLFHLTDALSLSVDAAYQYVKANGGGVTSAREQFFRSGGRDYTGVFGGVYYYGRDLNGDGELGLDVNGNGVIQDFVTRVGDRDVTTQEGDRITIVNPSQTRTDRYNAIVNLAYEVDPANRVRISYALDTGRHRQTGEGGYLYSNGEPVDVFPSNDPLADANGNVLQKRDRRSIATLHLFAAEYRGRFFDDTLTVLVGGSGRFFTRDLNQYCFTTASNGNVDCPAGVANTTAYAAAFPYSVAANGRPSGSAAPVSRTLNYNQFTPNVGMTYNFTPAFSFAVNYARNVSVPGTDALYNSLYAPVGSDAANPAAETSHSFDAGFRYTSSKVQAAVSPWYSQYKNRLVSAYNIECDCNIDTNLGDVKKYGVDASVSYRPVPELLLYAFGSYIGSEIVSDVRSSATAFFPTAGKRERGAPEWLAGGRIQGTLGDFQLGAQAKYTSERFLNDINTVEFNGYTVVDLDVRYSLASVGLPKTAVQFNVTNLFDEFYVGSFPGSLTGAGTAFVNFGPPRAVIGSLIVGF